MGKQIMVSLYNGILYNDLKRIKLKATDTEKNLKYMYACARKVSWKTVLE